MVKISEILVTIFSNNNLSAAEPIKNAIIKTQDGKEMKVSSNGKLTSRISFPLFFRDTDQHFRIAIKNESRESPFLRFYEKRHWALLKVKDIQGKEKFVIVNISSLSNRFGIDRATVVKFAKSHQGDVTDLVQNQLFSIIENMAEKNDPDANWALASMYFKKASEAEQIAKEKGLSPLEMSNKGLEYLTNAAKLGRLEAIASCSLAARQHIEANSLETADQLLTAAYEGYKVNPIRDPNFLENLGSLHLLLANKRASVLEFDKSGKSLETAGEIFKNPLLEKKTPTLLAGVEELKKMISTQRDAMMKKLLNEEANAAIDLYNANGRRNNNAQVEVNLRRLHVLAEMGSDVAASALGKIYENGSFGIQRDVEKAIVFHKRFSELGGKKIFINIAALYKELKDTKKEMEYLKKSAAEGEMKAKYKIAIHHACKGKDDKAIEELKKVSQSLPLRAKALVAMATMCINNPVLSFSFIDEKPDNQQDLEEQRKAFAKVVIPMLQEASALESPYAAIKLAQIYSSGLHGVERNIKLSNSFYISVLNYALQHLKPSLIDEMQSDDRSLDPTPDPTVKYRINREMINQINTVREKIKALQQLRK